MTRVRVQFEGRVQGVGFRWFVSRAAATLELAGRVRNLPDGSVEAEAEGPREGLERWIAAIREGPAHASVTGLSVDWSEGPPRWRGFHVA